MTEVTNQIAKSADITDEVAAEVRMGRDVIAYTDLFLTILMMLVMYVQCKQMGMTFFQRTYTWFDVVFYSIKLTQTYLIIAGNINEDAAA